jgi:hypothetical protein
MTAARRFAVLLAVGVACGGRPAWAAPADASERARTTFDQAREAFSRKSYAAAASAFEQSASYVGHPGPWVNAAEAWILAGDPVRAARACDRALAFADIDDATRTQAVERLQKVTPLIATVELLGPNLTARVDEGEPYSLPVTLRLAPGSHAFRVSLGATDLKWSREVGAGATARQEIVLRDGVPALRGHEPVPPRTERSWAPPPLSIAGYGVAATATAGVVFFGLNTLDARDNYREEDARSRFYLNRALTNVCLGVAAVAVVTSTILWVLRARSSR